MRLTVARALAALWALSWFLFPGFGLPDLSVSWALAWGAALVVLSAAPRRSELRELGLQVVESERPL